MAKTDKLHGFADPELRARAIEARQARPAGKANTRYEDIDLNLPGMWPGDRTTLGNKIGKREREAQAARAIVRLEGIVDDLFDGLEEVVRGERDLSTGQAAIMNKLVDKLLPDLRTTQGGGQKISRLLISAPLARLVEAGASVGVEMTEPEDEDAGDTE